MLKEALEIRAAVLEATTLENEKLFHSSGRVNRSLIDFAKAEVVSSAAGYQSICLYFSNIEVNAHTKAHMAALNQACREIMDGVK